MHWIPNSYCSTRFSFESLQIACTLELVIHIIYIAFLAYITTDNAELTGNSTTTNVRYEL